MLGLSHKNLEVYKISLKLVEEVYKVTKAYPKEEHFVLVSQIRRAAISVCSNMRKERRNFRKMKKTIL